VSLHPPAAADSRLPGRTNAPQYLAVGLVAGAIIALQICVMRIFAVGSWAHFGSLVVSLAMLGFGVSGVVIYLRRHWFERRWRLAAGGALALFGPLVVATNLAAQQVPFNAIFLVSDPAQKWRLLANFILYFLPFLAGALFLGTIFLIRQQVFGPVYFADMTGSGLSALAVLGAMYVFPPEDLVVVPLALWSLGGVLWFAGIGSRRGAAGQAGLAVAVLASHFLLPGVLGIPALAVSQYKGVSYARNYPDAKRIYRDVSPFGDLQIYSSSYMHFAPGLSDNAAFNLPEVPADAYLAMFIDGEGPEGIMRDLPPEQTAYFRYLPMFYPYVIKAAPDTFVAQFGGGISTMVALRSGSKSVTVAESNPAILDAFRDPQVRSFTGDILRKARVRVVPYEGRLFLASAPERYDVVDLSLADSVGLSNPGGFAIVEKYAYTREALTSYMRALRDDGVLSVTLWNKEEPPKSILRLYASIAEAARAVDGNIADDFFVASTYLATTTVLYKRGGFTADEVAKLREYTRSMSFDEIYYPGFAFDPGPSAPVLDDYRSSVFGTAAPDDAAATEENGAAQPPGDAVDQTAPDSDILPATTLGRLVWNGLVHGGFDEIARQYVFDTHPLTNDRPYFAGYVKPVDLIRALDRLDTLQDDWGYLLIWATLVIASLAGMTLIVIPVIFGWRVVFSRSRGKLGTLLYFACLGLGYITVEVGLISRFIVALGNATISATVLITGMLVFSGIGSLASERILGAARAVLPGILLVIGLILFGYTLWLDQVLGWLGTYSYAVRVLLCITLIAPPAFLMGFPMPTAMTSLARLGKSDMFVWAWGINGSFSVVGAAAVPLIATTLGLDAVLQSSATAYLIAIPAFFAVTSPARKATTVMNG
jgi:hypothetical protein